jgi:hypothetical protein
MSRDRRGLGKRTQTTAAAIGELNDVVNELVGRFDGVRPVEQGERDSFVAPFAPSPGGIGCARSVQRALLGEMLRVRMGVHTGDVVRPDEGPGHDPHGPVANLAHGGQTGVSEATKEPESPCRTARSWLSWVCTSLKTCSARSACSSCTTRTFPRNPHRCVA